VNYQKSYYEKGIKVLTINRKREIPEAKSLNYQILYSNKERMKSEGAEEMIYVSGEEALEATTSNLFIVRDEKIITSQKDILMGVTRKIVIDLIKKNNTDLELRKVSSKELFDADEVFITASNKRVMPVVQVDNKLISKGSVGIVTKDMIELFKKYEKDGGQGDIYNKK